MVWACAQCGETCVVPGGVQVTDFGFARELQPGERAHTLAGSYGYLCPELCRRQDYDHGCDMWSFGVTCYALEYGLLPFAPSAPCASSAEYNAASKANTLNNDVQFPEKPEEPSCALKSLIFDLLRKRPDERLGAHMDFKEVMAHEWFWMINWEALKAQRLPAPYVPNNDRGGFSIA